jgi:hypothetical protein
VAALVAAAPLADRLAFFREEGDWFRYAATDTGCRLASVGAPRTHCADLGDDQLPIGAGAHDAGRRGQRGAAGDELGHQLRDGRRRADGQRGRVGRQCRGQTAQKRRLVGNDRVDRVGDDSTGQLDSGRSDVGNYRVAAGSRGSAGRAAVAGRAGNRR